MRLTLRTLLAYLDDVLTATDTKEIGAKIAESDQASVLISRIRDVMRRRRLTAPDVAGPNSGLDPNIVSEYIDNTLPADNVAQVEQICLDSDIHLAEVAACHQIVVLCESLKASQEGVKAPPKMREHIYALGPGGKKVAVAAAPVPQPAPVPKSGFSDEVPDYLKTPAGKGSGWWYALAAVLGLVWVGIVLSDSSLFRRGQEQNGQSVEVAQNAAPANPPEVAADAVKQPEAKPAVPAQPAPANPTQPNVPIDAMPPEDDGQKTPMNMTDDTPPAPVTLPMTPVNPQPANPNPKPPEPVASIPNANPPLPMTNNPPLPQPGVVPAAPERELPPIEYGLENEGILLISEPSRSGWHLLSKQTRLRGGEQLASPDPFEAHLSVGGSRAKIYLGTQTAVTVMKGSDIPENCEFGLDIRQGKVALTGDAGAAEAQQIVPVAIRVSGETWRLELLTPDTRCGIEIIPRQPEAPNQVFTKDGYTGTLRTLTGAVKLADGTGKVWQLNAGEQFPLTPVRRAELASLEGSVPMEKMASVPDWLDPAVSAISTSRRNFGRKYEKEFTAPSVTDSIRPLLDANNPQMAEAATRTLALIEDYDQLVKCLLESTYGEARKAAIQGLRDWLPRSVQHGPLLMQSLTQRLIPEDATLVDRLLWGYSEQDAKNPELAVQLTNRLEHPKSYVRQLAILQLERLTGSDHGFQPDQSDTVRARKIQEIRARIERQGGLLKP